MGKLSTRRRDIDIARAIAIFVVVLSHIPQWYSRYHFDYFSQRLAVAIEIGARYTSITMFMFAAGMIVAMKGRRCRSLAEYFEFERNKFYRLMLPYLSVSIIQMVVKIVLSKISLSEVPSSLIAMLIFPRVSPAPHLWFLYTLMSIFLIWPILEKIAGTKGLPWLWGVLVFIAIVPLPSSMDSDLFHIWHTKRYLAIFTLGYWYGRHPLGQRKYGPIAVATIGILMLLAIYFHRFVTWPQIYPTILFRNLIQLFGNMCGAVFMLWLCGLFADSSSWIVNRINNIGFYSYDVYLLHVAFAGHPMMVLISKLNPGPVMTYVWFLLIFIGLMAIPILIGKLIRRIPVLSFIVLGSPLKK